MVRQGGFGKLFNETDDESGFVSSNLKKGPPIQRVAITFHEARIFFSMISIDDLVKDCEVVMDVRGHRSFTSTDGYMRLHKAPMRGDRLPSQPAESRGFAVHTGLLRVRLIESTWLCDPVAHRLEPLHGSIRKQVNPKEHDSDTLRTKAQECMFTLSNALVCLQEQMTLQNDVVPGTDKKQTIVSADFFDAPDRDRDDYLMILWLEEKDDEARRADEEDEGPTRGNTEAAQPEHTGKVAREQRSASRHTGASGAVCTT